jgi:hypothetical protein
MISARTPVPMYMEYLRFDWLIELPGAAVFETH